MTGDIHLDRNVSAPRSELWNACATPRGLEGWCADRVIGTVGQSQTIRLEWPSLGMATTLNVAEYAPGERVVFKGGSTAVTLAVGNGRVSLTHSGLSPKDDREGFWSSWRVGLALLAHSVETHPGKHRKSAWFLGRARASARLAHVYYTDSEALSAWLARGPGLQKEGERYFMTGLSGDPMTGTVLAADGGRDVAFSWEETDDSVVVLRSLPSPASKDERVIAMCWSRWLSASPETGAQGKAEEAEIQRVEGELKRAVQRLALVLDRSGIA